MPKLAPRTFKFLSFACIAASCLFSSTVPAAEVLKERDVLALAFRQNLGVQADRLQPAVAETEIDATKSVYDTRVSGQAYYNLDRSDKETIVLGTDNHEILYEAKVEKRFPFGMDGAIRFSNIHNRTNSAFATDPTFFDTGLNFDVSAPMLKNRFGKSDRLAVDLSRQNMKVVEKQTLNAVQEQLARAATQYWNWVASQEYEALASRFLKIAKDFEVRTEDKKTLGLAEETDIFATSANVEEREAELLRAKNLYEDLRKALQYTLDLDWDQNIRAGERLGVSGASLSREEAVAIALRRRPDYHALLEEAKAKNIQIALNKDQKLPGLDLASTLLLNSVDPNYGAALGQTFSAQHPNWLVGARFELFLENRLAKSQLKKSEIEKLQVLVRIKDMENLIALEIDERLRELALQRKEYQKYARAADLQSQKLNSEQEKFGLGRSNSDTIIRFQGDYLDAARRALEAKVRLQIAWVDLRKSMATLLPEGATSLAPPITPSVSQDHDR